MGVNQTLSLSSTVHDPGFWDTHMGVLLFYGHVSHKFLAGFEPNLLLSPSSGPDTLWDLLGSQSRIRFFLCVQHTFQIVWYDKSFFNSDKHPEFSKPNRKPKCDFFLSPYEACSVSSSTSVCYVCTLSPESEARQILEPLEPL